MERRAAVPVLGHGGLAGVRAWTLVQLHRSTFRYVAHPADDQELLTQITAVAARHPRYGSRWISALLNRSQRANQKRVRRLWRWQGLQVRRVKRKRPRRPPAARVHAAYPGHVWA